MTTQMPGAGPILVFGGTYSNLSATQALIAEAQALEIPPENCICTGDVVAYCAHPGETIKALREWGCTIIMGNCEESLALQAMDCGCGFEEGSACSVLAVDWYRYTNSKITQSERQWMAQLPREFHCSWSQLQICAVHGAPSRINRFIFSSTDLREKQREMEQINCSVILAGHSGLPFGNTLSMANDRQGFWLNSGASGLPANDGTPNVWYMLLEPLAERVRVSWHRLNYDYKAESEAMRAAGLDDYADTLCSGRWPSLDILPPAEAAQTGRPMNPAPLIIESPHRNYAHSG